MNMFCHIFSTNIRPEWFEQYNFIFTQYVQISLHPDCCQLLQSVADVQMLPSALIVPTSHHWADRDSGYF